MKWWILVIIVVLLGCQSDTDNTPRPSSTSLSPTVELTPTLTPQQRLDYETQYEALRQSQVAIEDVWRALQANQTISCADEIPQEVTPANITPSEDAIGQLLLKAATEINDAIVLWYAECQNPRPVPPATTIDEGLRLALAGAQTLMNIERDLQQ